MSDGIVKKIIDSNELEVGMVVREANGDGTVPPFGDAVIVRRHVAHAPDESRYLVARPYVFVSGADTGCPTPLTGVEQFDVSFSGLRERYVLVCRDRGEPFRYVT